MTSAAIRKNIELRIMELKAIITELEPRVDSGKSIVIRASSEKGRMKFYVIGDNSKKEYISIRNTSRIASLSQMLYERRLLKASKEEMRILGCCLKHLDSHRIPADANEAFVSLNQEIRKFVRPDPSTDEGYANKWCAEIFYQQKKTEAHKFETLGKNLVRSKSEVIIADRLFKAGIPYRYEQLLLLDKRTMLKYYPDFTILNKKTRKIFYWEHLGRLGDPAYCADNLVKLEDYARHGIIQGKNLILTYECDGKPLSTTLTDILIKEFLL